MADRERGTEPALDEAKRNLVEAQRHLEMMLEVARIAREARAVSYTHLTLPTIYSV